jgi:hypothetical protein
VPSHFPVTDTPPRKRSKPKVRTPFDTTRPNHPDPASQVSRVLDQVERIALRITLSLIFLFGLWQVLHEHLPAEHFDNLPPLRQSLPHIQPNSSPQLLRMDSG